jgi:CHAT domain-containing protein/tetratricopeptide (TPR) repeat protein
MVTILSEAGSLSSSRGSIPPAKKRPAIKEKPEFMDLRSKANVLYKSGDYAGASRMYESGYSQAIARGETRSALRFLINLGSANYALFQYREAIKAYLKAKDLAARQNDQEMLAAVYLNIASIYFQMGDIDGASESAAGGLAQPAGAAKYKAQLLILSSEIESLRKNSARAVSLLHDAIAAAKAANDAAIESLCWNELGTALFERGDLAGAEQALLEALRIRQATGDDHIHYTWEALAELRLRQGNEAEAARLYDKAIAAAEPLGPSAAWTAYFLRGRARLSHGKTEDAYRDLGESLRLIRIARVRVLPADAFRIGQEAQLDEVYAAYIEAGSKLYRKTGRASYVQQTFAAAEESRAASLRALWAGADLTARMPPEYWKTIVELQQGETAMLHQQKGAEEQVRHARVRLTELEMQAGLDVPDGSNTENASRTNLLRMTQSSLGSDEIFIGFHMGQVLSCVWVVSREGSEFRELPATGEFAARVAAFTRAVQEGSPQRAALGLELYSLLFGKISRKLLDHAVWIVAPEGPLFELPFAALNQEAGYLIERHAISIAPGAFELLGTRAGDDDNGSFVGVGDPIYNRADSRLGRSAPAKNLPLELARLPGSGREVRMCAGIWKSHGQKTILLEGAAADKQNLTDAIRQNPGVVHIAGHVLFSGGEPGPGMLALTLQPGSQIQLLSATEVAGMRAKLGLVVLDGCSSARGAILPGAGLIGMTRAWMAAGAHAVIATRWPMADRDEGALFRDFYPLYYLRNARSHTAISRVLRETQLAQLRAGGPHAEPAYWASYFSVERN